MKKGLESTGVPSQEELEKSPGYPCKQRLLKGPVAVLECVQEIPCDPCEKACPFGAIRVGQPITNLPTLNTEKCTGCGTCIASCPGLAIFVLDYTFSDDEALITFPYEFLPLPEVGSMVDATNREGKVITRGKVIKVLTREVYDHTVIVSIAIPKRFIHEVRGIARPMRNREERI